MSAFKNLQDVSNAFEVDIHKLTSELFAAKIRESFEESLCKKLRDISLYTSKLRLLRAKPIASNPQIAEQIQNDETTIEQYEETASAKVLEQHIVKFLTQSNAVQKLITKPSRSLHPELVERKEKIIEALSQFRNQESQLRQLDTVLREKEEELAAVRLQWDKELGELRDARDGADGSMEVEPGPLNKKLRTLVDKMELMRWLVSKLVTSRSGRYDWLSDPHGRLRALKVAREDITLDKILRG